ncbi:TetR/AcrR family transcriptional regulator [Hyphomicrobium sp. DMF-1]|uniref:TetR/AcrR family transcriptional regulator n=1 Tax=Hyphomicrobium sp. DMF-1 TaxID=3019544 RepID=UPI0022EBE108|nr:TetR/AcrR family transcriptional regulator [Hyphomicrobium sp. DMF-1]WBT38041.1 TetR/AcrR family transcriptional regulator [Hyphomicrobium sp. DMF-1]
MAPAHTKSALLSEAEALIRTIGYAGFSYADLSERVGIRKASIHHHFPTKEALGAAVIDTYLERFVAELDALAARSINARRKLLAYGDFFAASLQDGQMPLCGALAADATYLPVSMQQRVRKFFELHLTWLEKVLADGIAAGEIDGGQSPKTYALLLLSTLQGASIVAWALKDPSVVKPAYRQALERLAR